MRHSDKSDRGNGVSDLSAVYDARIGMSAGPQGRKGGKGGDIACRWLLASPTPMRRFEAGSGFRSVCKSYRCLASLCMSMEDQHLALACCT